MKGYKIVSVQVLNPFSRFDADLLGLVPRHVHNFRVGRVVVTYIPAALVRDVSGCEPSHAWSLGVPWGVEIGCLIDTRLISWRKHASSKTLFAPDSGHQHL
jgi:hypothetical protein